MPADSHALLRRFAELLTASDEGLDWHQHSADLRDVCEEIVDQRYDVGETLTALLDDNEEQAGQWLRPW